MRGRQTFLDFDLNLGEKLKNNHNLLQVLKKNLPSQKYTTK